MTITKKHIFSLLIIFIIAIGAISIASAYTGTGFSHNIPSSKYSDMSVSDILNKYSNTNCHVEESAVCTKVVDGDTIYLDNGEKVRFVVDGKNLNEMLLKEGLAEIMYMPPSEFYPYDWANGNTPTSSHQTSSSSSDTGSSASHSSSDSGSYIGNANSGKFHVAGCGSVGKMSEKNKVFFSSRSEAINQGYVPCKRCNP